MSKPCHSRRRLASYIIYGKALGAADKEFLQKIENTKRQAKASEIKAVTIPFSLSHKPRELIPSKLVPKEISSLPILSEAMGLVEASYLTDDKTGTNAVIFEIGSGGGSWGIIVCPTETDNCRKARSGLKGTVIPWEDGVYFLADWHVKGVSKDYWNKE